MTLFVARTEVWSFWKLRSSPVVHHHVTTVVFVSHTRTNDEFCAVEMHKSPPLVRPPVPVTLELRREARACDCVQRGGRRPVKWDTAPSICAADLCTLAGGRNEFSPLRLGGLMNLGARQLLQWSISPLNEWMNGAVSRCITLWINTRISRFEKKKVARRKDPETLMKTVAEDNLKPL